MRLPKATEVNLFLMLEIRKQWFNLMHGKEMQGLLLTITKRGILKFHEFTVSYLKSRYTETNIFRKNTSILSLTCKGKQGKGVIYGLLQNTDDSKKIEVEFISEMKIQQILNFDSHIQWLIY